MTNNTAISKTSCPHCYRLIDLEDEYLKRGFETLLKEYYPAPVDYAGDNKFNVDLASLRIVFEFGKNEAWRVFEAWVEVPHMNLHFSGKRTWLETPIDAVRAVFDTKHSSFDGRVSANNP